MIPFFVPDLLKLVKDLLARFIKQDVLGSLATCADVSAFDTSKKDNHCTISLGFSADKLLRSEGFKKRKVSDRDMLGFENGCKNCASDGVVQKTPIKYPLARALSCLDPRNMAATHE